MGHYFRNLYHIVKFVDQSDVPDKRFYTSLLRAQLSTDELFLLYYNGLSVHGEKFKPLIVKYALLKNLPPDALISQDPENQAEGQMQYPPGAFEGSKAWAQELSE